MFSLYSAPFKIALPLLFSASVLALQNVTITVSDGSTFYHNPDELCHPAKWTDILAFFGANYVAHALTVRPIPGSQFWDTAKLTLTCLFFPSWGLGRALYDIMRLAAFGETSLEKAARAGALYTVVRNEDWQPRPEDRVVNILIKRDDGHRGRLEICDFALIQPVWADWHWGFTCYLDRGPKTLRATIQLPRGYSFSMLPANALVKQLRPSSEYTYHPVTYSHNWTKIVIAVVQLLFASAAIYKASIQEVKHFGYAAFGLTVTPYAIMSLANLLATLICPDFSSTYLVRSQILDEAWKRLTPPGTELPHNEVVGDLMELLPGGIEAPRLQRSGYILVYEAIFKKSEKEGEKLVDTFISTEPAQTAPGATTNTVQNQYSIGDSKSLLVIPTCNRYKTSPCPLLRFTKFTWRAQAVNQEPKKANYDDEKFLPFRWTVENYISILLAALMYAVVIGIIGSISHFDPAYSTLAQRVWTMMWLATGLSLSSFGHIFDLLEMKMGGRNLIKAGWILIQIILVVPAIGGFVVVAQMLREFGYCISL